MHSRRTLAALLLATSTLAMAVPADADRVTATDPAGDASMGQALDVTSIRVVNRDHTIVTVVSFARATRGDLGIRYQARGDKRGAWAVVFSRHRAHGTRTWFGQYEEVQRCKGIRVSWDHAADTARVRLPSRCFREGDYGAVRAKVITEIGMDADLAPKNAAGAWTWTPWADRG